MALNSGKILMRRGQEVNFDPNKMMPGEWAVSLDSKFVRMCFSPGVCVRMATYEAFEADMEQIRQILAECESIEQAVSLINTEVSQNAKVVIEYTEEAKQYRDEALQFRNEAEQFTPDGYDSLVGQVNKNTVSINTIVEKAELNIKETASGESIHLDDSAEGKAVEFALYGKAVQNGTPTPQNPVDIEVAGENYNLLENPQRTSTSNEVLFQTDKDGITLVNGTATNGMASFNPGNQIILKEGKYILSGCPKGGSDSTYRMILGLKYSDGTYYSDVKDYGDGKEFTITKEMVDIGVYGLLFFYVFQGYSASNLTFKPMIRKASVKNDRYMPYGKGSVEVKSVGKNKLKNTATSQTINGVTFTVNEDKSITANGTATALTRLVIASKQFLSKGSYCFSGSIGGASSSYQIFATLYDVENQYYGERYNQDGQNLWDIPKDSYVTYNIDIKQGTKLENVVFYPMIRLASDKDETYEPYKETISTIPTTDFAGIKVSSGGNYTDSNGQQWIANEIVKYADGSGEKIQRVGKAVFDGSEDETWYIDGQGRWVSKSLVEAGKTLAAGELANALCDRYQVKTGSQTYERNEGVSVSNVTAIIYESNYSASDKATWTSYLAENPTTLYYELSEPIHTPLTAEEIAEIEKLSTFYPVTNISNDFDCGMKVKYIVDSKNYIDNQLAIQAKLQEEALLNMLLLMPEEVQASMIEKDTNNLLNESEV